MQRFRADFSEKQVDGAIRWYARWMGDNTLAKIANCRFEGLAGEMRGTVYATGDADTYFSIPAVTRIKGCRVKGYITGDGDRNLVFHHVYYA